MPVVTFPHMGNLKIPSRAFFKKMGLEVVVPPEITRKTIELGVKHSPEMACLPLKINLGNFIEALEKGAEIIVMGGGNGPCRFGYYGQVQQEILTDLGYDFQLLSLEGNLLYTFNRLRDLLGGFSLLKIAAAWRLAWAKITVMDRITELVLASRAREAKAGQVDEIYQEFLQELDEIMEPALVRQLEAKYRRRIKDCLLAAGKGRQVKIGIVGEIYVVLEGAANLHTARRLGRLGAEVAREISLTHWLKDFLNMSHSRTKIRQKGRPYINSFVGGHGEDSVGGTIHYSEQGFDGIVHLAPFTCMPEIVAQGILEEVSTRENIPVMSLVFDEHSAEAGLQTRLEAFVDLLARGKATG